MKWLAELDFLKMAFHIIEIQICTNAAEADRASDRNAKRVLTIMNVPLLNNFATCTGNCSQPKDTAGAGSWNSETKLLHSTRLSTGLRNFPLSKSLMSLPRSCLVWTITKEQKKE